MMPNRPYTKIFLYALDGNNNKHFIHSFLDEHEAMKHARKHHSLSIGYKAYYYVQGDRLVWLITDDD